MHFKKCLLSAGISCLASISFAQAPTDNPISSYYGANAYQWTGEMIWDNVVDVTLFGATPDDGQDDRNTIHAAIDAVYAAGGGVVYFPAGTYNIEGDLILKSGVILRGANPPEATATPVHQRGDGSLLAAPAQRSDYAPPSKLVFPEYVPTFTGTGTPNNTAFKVITVADQLKDSNWGLVNLDINHARIINFVNVTSTSAFEQTEVTFDPDFDQRNIVLFGLRANHMITPDPAVPNGSQELWQRYPARGSANLNLIAYENILVANNRLNSDVSGNFAMPGYKLSNGSLPGKPSGQEITFKYTDNYGIVINRFSRYTGGSPASMEPNSYPETLRKGIAVRDNWLFNTMRVGYHISGQDAVILDNVKADQPGKWSGVGPSGRTVPFGSDTFENRGVDFSGFNVLVEGNDLDVHSHALYQAGASTPFIGAAVDGESILNQAHTTTIVRGAWVNNNYVKGYIGIYKTRDSEDIEIIGNRIRAGSGTRQNIYQNIYVTADINGNPNMYLKNVLIDSNILTTQDDVTIQGTGGIDNVTVSNHPVGDELKITPGVISTNNFFNTTTLFPAPAAYNPRPEVTLSASVVDGAYLAEGTDVTLTATATHSSGIDRVEYWSNQVMLGQSSVAPYTIVLENLSASAKHNVYARAVAVDGKTNWGMFSIAFRVSDIPQGNAFTAWQSVNFGANASDPAIAGPDADPDRDGVANLIEFFLGMNPNQPSRNSQPTLVEVEHNSQTYLALRFLPSAEAAELNYAVIAGATPGNGVAIPAENLSVDLEGYIIARDTQPIQQGAPRFLRLQVSMP